MQVVGIVAEYDPFHTGHAYQIARTRAELGEDAPVVAVMSGCWVQGGGDLCTGGGGRPGRLRGGGRPLLRQ